MSPQKTIYQLAEHIKAAVSPHLGEWRSRRITGIANSGDTTFNIDEIAEDSIIGFLQSHSLNLAYYSEDRGLIKPTTGKTPDGILIIDPIDGTRGAIAGLEPCVVSVAWADYGPAPTIADVRYAVVTDIKGDLSFTAERGAGLQILNGKEEEIKPFLAPVTQLSDMAWTTQAVGAPLDLYFRVLGRLASESAVRGGFFILNSSAFEMTRIVSGQLHAMVDVRCRLLRDFPQTRERYLQHGGGRLLSLYGYDVAAAVLICREAGCVVTDGWGRDLSNWDLMDTTESNFGSMIAAANAELHSNLLAAVNEGFERLASEL